MNLREKRGMPTKNKIENFFYEKEMAYFCKERMQRIEKPTLSRMSNMIDSEINLLPKMDFYFDDEVNTPPPLPPSYVLSRTCSVGEEYVFTPHGVVYNPDMIQPQEKDGVIPSYPIEDIIPTPPPNSSDIYTCLYSVYSSVLGLTEDCCDGENDMFHWLEFTTERDNDSKIQRSTCLDGDYEYDGPGFDVAAVMNKMVASEKLKKL